MDLTKELKENNITKTELSKRLGVTWQTVHNWCKDPDNLSIKKINNIRSAY